MRITDITPDWIRLRARAKGMRLSDLAKEIGIERTKLSKSLNEKRNFLGWELAKIGEILGEAEPYANQDPELNALVNDYLSLDKSDRARARALLRALLAAEAPQETQQESDGRNG